MKEKLIPLPSCKGRNLEETLESRGHLSQASKKEQMFPGREKNVYKSREEWKYQAEPPGKGGPD